MNTDSFCFQTPDDEISWESPLFQRNVTPVPKLGKAVSHEQLSGSRTGLRRIGDTLNRSLDKPVLPLPKGGAFPKENEDPFLQPKYDMASQSSFSLGLGRKKSIKMSKGSPTKQNDGENKRGFKGFIARLAGDGGTKKEHARPKIVLKGPAYPNSTFLTPEMTVGPNPGDYRGFNKAAGRKDFQTIPPDSAPPKLPVPREYTEANESVRSRLSEDKKANSTPTSMEASQLTRRYIQENSLARSSAGDIRKSEDGERGGMLLSEGRISPTKDGSFGVAKRVEVNPGMFHVTSHQGILEEALREEARSAVSENKTPAVDYGTQNALNLIVPETFAPVKPAEAYSPSVYEGVWERSSKVVSEFARHRIY